jgi:hypothetical protein
MLVTSVSVRISEIRNGILQLLLNAFNNGTFVNAIPEIVAASYLGPMLNTTEVMGPANGSTLEQKGGSVVFFVLSLAVITVSLILIPIAVRECVRKALLNRKSS